MARRGEAEGQAAAVGSVASSVVTTKEEQRRRKTTKEDMDSRTACCKSHLDSTVASNRARCPGARLGLGRPRACQLRFFCSVPYPTRATYLLWPRGPQPANTVAHPLSP